VKDNQLTQTRLAAYHDWPQLRTCIQCGTCSGSCPLAPVMDITPRRLVGLVVAGRGAEALQSQSIWMCASCYTCTLRCPRGIPLTEVIYALKREFRRENPQALSPFYAGFTRMVRLWGRVNERQLMLHLAAATPLKTLLQIVGVGAALVWRKRLLLETGQAIHGTAELARLWQFAERKGG